MNDLLLWRSLQGDDYSPDEIIPLLEELAGQELAERFPFLGLLDGALGHVNPRVRRAATAVLAGAAGFGSFQRIVRGLADNDQDVLLAAMESLRASAQADPARWIHALFHPQPAIREAALRGKPVTDTEWYHLYLLPDGSCGLESLRQLSGRSMPAAHLGTVVELCRREYMERPAARRLLAGVSVEQWKAAILKGTSPDTSEPEESPAGFDPLGDVFELWFDEGVEHEADDFTQECPSRAFFSRLTSVLYDLPRQRARIANLFISLAQRQGRWSEDAARLCAVFQPEFLLQAAVPPEVRRRAVRGLYEAADRCPKREETLVQQIIRSPLCRRPSGNFDLWVLGGLLYLLQSKPYEWLIECCGIGRLVSACLEDIEEAAPLFSLPDASPLGRRRLIEELFKVRAPEQCFFYALMVYIVPCDSYSFLEALTAPQAAEVLENLLRLWKRPEMALSERKIRVAAELLAARLSLDAFARFLPAWLAEPEAERFQLGVAVFGALATRTEGEQLAAMAAALENSLLRKFLLLVAWCPGFPYGKEIQLALALAAHEDAEVRSWTTTRCPTTAEPPKPKGLATGLLTLSDAAARRIATCYDVDLADAVSICRQGQWQGVAAALAARPLASPNIAVCAALLGCHDPIPEVEAQFSRFAADDPAFLALLDRMMVESWVGQRQLSLLGRAWLHRWESHSLAVAAEIVAKPAAVADILRLTRSMSHPLLRQQVWALLEQIVSIWRYRDKTQLAAICLQPLVDELLGELPGPCGDCAARILVQIGGTEPGGRLLREAESQLWTLLPDLSQEVRTLLLPWVDSKGMPAPAVQRRVRRRPAAELAREIAAQNDLDRLEALCREDHADAAGEAALRLVALGNEGTVRLAKVLGSDPAVPCAGLLAETVSLWPDGPPLEAVRELLRQDKLPPQVHFLAGAELVSRGEAAFLDGLLRVAAIENEGDAPSWFRPEDWQRLLTLGVPPRRLAMGLARSRHPHAYGPAVRYLTGLRGPDAEAAEALERFLECGTERMREVRLGAALWLHAHGNHSGFPLLLQAAACDEREVPGLLAGVSAELVAACVRSVLIVGPKHVEQKWLVARLDVPGTDAAARQAAWELLLADGSCAKVRDAVLAKVRHSPMRSWKLRRVAEDFLWGMQRGRELTGRLFSVEMIAGDQLGYTRLSGSKICVNPTPALRGEENGQEILRGLILHEIGHHKYHRGEPEAAVWQQAERQQLGGLLNLVADEHLERNLRGMDRDFGNKLKRLAAYAFQHASREIAVERLLACLRSRSFEVLSAVPLRAARNRGCVRVENGKVLAEAERAGLSFSRFMRALRMGLGNRYGDPKVAEALDLFRRQFRRCSMLELLEIAKELRRIFGSEAELLDWCGQDGALGIDPAELAAAGESITDAEIQSEIIRITKKPPRREGEDRRTPFGRVINVGPDEHFDPIHNIIRVAFDPARHAPYAAAVARHARQFRHYLQDLGIVLQVQTRRLQGRSIDRARIPDLMVRGDPRILRTRQRKSVTDLFLGVLVDCSGSMAYHEHIQTARLFGAMLAEASRGLRGVDLRLFGFTDSAIYDAGDADRPAMHALEAGGGNNDAGALWHAAQLALASRRAGRLLVMISDGLPTECSVAALRALVARLTRRMGICCAQLAVAPLEEVCFPHYVVLNPDDPDACVRRFGVEVARLVRAALHLKL